jgi:hypothetical protein
MTSGGENTAIGAGSMQGTSTSPLTGNYNTAVGNSALQYIGGAAAHNTAVGNSAMAGLIGSPLTGASNTAFGDAALTAIITTGNSNTAIGQSSFTALTTGSNNVGVGYFTGSSLTTGTDDTFLGYDAGIFQTSSGETAVGSNALFNATSSQFGVAVGYQALLGSSVISSTGFNTAVGYASLRSITSGNSNTAMGYQTLLNNTSGTGNIAIGPSSMSSVTTGSSNVAIGQSSGLSLVSGSNNVFIGGSGTGHSETGSANVFLGRDAGFLCSSGNSNIMIGQNIDCPVAAGSGQLNIGSVIFGTGMYNNSGGPLSSTPNSGGAIGIGTSSPYARLEVWGPDTASTSAFVVANSASTTVFAVYDSGNSTYSGSIFQSSDQRLKTDIRSLDASSSLSFIDALNPVSYIRLDQPGQGSHLGFVAQGVQKIFPQLVSSTSPTALTPDGTLTLNYVGLIAPIVKAIQALSTEVTSLENMIAGFADSFTTKELSFNRATGDELTVKKLNTQQLCTTKSDGTAVCVTGDQLAAVLAGTHASQSRGGTAVTGATPPPSSDTSSSSSQSNIASSTPYTPPVIQINGGNPAIIHVGDTYSDLGATITGPQADLNLGISTYVNGTAMSPVQLDTTEAATDTIDYVVTDQSGLIATSTRTVIVEQVATHNSADPTTGVATSSAADPASNSTSTLSDSRNLSL